MTLINIIPYIRETIISLERKYKRNCFKCKKQLNLLGFIRNNFLDKETYIFNLTNEINKILKNKFDYLIKIWCSKIIELYCCTCFVDIRKKEMEKLIKECHKKYFERSEMIK